MSAGVVTKLNHLEKELNAHFNLGYVFIAFKSRKDMAPGKCEVTTRIAGTPIALVNAIKVLTALLESQVTKEEKPTNEITEEVKL